MVEYMHLIGAEDVRAASNNMRQAADDMQRAAGSISDTLEAQRRYMDEWIGRFESAVKEMRESPNAELCGSAAKAKGTQ